MLSYLDLSIAIVVEVIGTTALKASESFTRPLPSLVVVPGYSAAFYFLSLCLKSIPVGVAYAIWSGLMGLVRDGPHRGRRVGREFALQNCGTLKRSISHEHNRRGLSAGVRQVAGRDL